MERDFPACTAEPRLSGYLSGSHKLRDRATTSRNEDFFAVGNILHKLRQVGLRFLQLDRLHVTRIAQRLYLHKPNQPNQNDVQAQALAFKRQRLGIILEIAPDLDFTFRAVRSSSDAARLQFRVEPRKIVELSATKFAERHSSFASLMISTARLRCRPEGISQYSEPEQKSKG